MNSRPALPALAVCLAALLILPSSGCAPGDTPAPSPGSAVGDLLWADEFDTPGAPSAEFWGYEVNCWGGGNDERQCYTDRTDNAYVDDDGFLHIVAREETYEGPSIQDDDPEYPGPAVRRAYTSSRLRTKNKVDWKYGRIEIRARVPGGQGIWPAIWMLPTDWVYGGWPASGEIDIVEAVNLKRGDFEGAGNVVHGTLHYGLPWPQWENHGRSYPMDVNPADGFHVYALEWEADEIRWYLDGDHYQTQRSDGWYNYVWGGQETGFQVANARAPFDQRFHLILNVAVGGNWPGPPDTGWDGDREMLVDWVRVYKGKRGPIDPSVEVHRDAGAPSIQDYAVYRGGVASMQLPVADSEETVEKVLIPGYSAGSDVVVDSRPKTDGPWEIRFSEEASATGSAAGVFLRSTAGLLLEGGSGWTQNGEVEFDLKVDRVAPGTELFVAMSGLSNGAGGRVAIDIPPAGEWQHVAVKIADLIAAQATGETPLDETPIDKPFVLQATGTAHLQVDNIRLQCAFNPEPEDWQIDKTCRLAIQGPGGGKSAS